MCQNPIAKSLGNLVSVVLVAGLSGQSAFADSTRARCDVYRSKGLGEDEQIFRMPDESVYVYWDATSLPGAKDGANEEKL